MTEPFDVNLRARADGTLSTMWNTVTGGRVGARALSGRALRSLFPLRTRLDAEASAYGLSITLESTLLGYTVRWKPATDYEPAGVRRV